MFVRVVKFIITAVSLTTIPLCCFAIKSNDFTKASSSATKRFKNERSSLTDKKSSMTATRFGVKDYYDSSKESNLEGMRFGSEDASNYFDVSDRATDSSKRFSIPEYHGGTGLWANGDKKSVFVNSERNFTKKYRGKIDVTRRNQEYQDFIERYYGTLVDRSMEDINKYYSRTAKNSHVDKVKTAGLQLRGEDEDGFFDFLSFDTKIDRKAVSFTGVEKKIRPRVSSNTGDNASAENADVSADIGVSPNSPALPTPALSPVKNIGTLNDSNAIVETIDTERAKNLNFLKVPDQFRSKATIKVKVKD